MDAAIDLSVSLDLSLNSGFGASSNLTTLSSSLTVLIDETFSTSISTSAGEIGVSVAPEVVLSLSAVNNQVPFDIFNSGGLSKLSSFDFTGAFFAQVAVEVDGVPAQVTFQTALDDLTNASSIQFGVFIDM